MSRLGVLFVSSGKANLFPGPIVESQAVSLQEQGVHISHFTVNKGGSIGYLKESFRLRRLLKNNKFDIIHAHYGLTAIICLLARRKEKLVVSFMGDDLVGSRKNDGRITKISIILARFNSLLASWFYDYSIVKSEQMLNKLRTKSVALIPNGVNTKLFKPNSKQETRKKLRIDPNLKLVIFISKPERAEKNYSLAEKAVRNCDVANISLLPLYGLDHKCLVDYYNAADVMVLTSFHEGSPNVIKEAMACNCPIVSTDVGDVNWVLGETEGCYIASFDPKDFSDKIKLALEFSEKQGQTKGRKRIIELGLDTETIAKKIISVYQKTLETSLNNQY